MKFSRSTLPHYTEDLSRHFSLKWLFHISTARKLQIRYYRSQPVEVLKCVCAFTERKIITQYKCSLNKYHGILDL